MNNQTGQIRRRPSAQRHQTAAPAAAKKQTLKTVNDHDRPAANVGPPSRFGASGAEGENCVALHTFEGLDLDQITSITPRQDYSGAQNNELLNLSMAAVQIAKLGSQFSLPVFLELDRRFKAGKKTKEYFLGFKSIDALCKRIGISRKQFYNVINDNPGGRRQLSPAEQEAKEAAKEEARIKREEARADREAKRRAEKERLKRQEEELRAAREINRKLQQSLDRTDDAVAMAKQAGADEVISKVAAAAQKEKRPEGFSPEPKTDRDLYYFTIGAQSVKGVSLGSPASVVKIVLLLLDGQTAGRQKEEVREILRGLSLGIEGRINRFAAAADLDLKSDDNHEQDQGRLPADYPTGPSILPDAAANAGSEG